MPTEQAGDRHREQIIQTRISHVASGLRQLCDSLRSGSLRWSSRDVLGAVLETVRRLEDATVHIGQYVREGELTGDNPRYHIETDTEQASARIPFAGDGAKETAPHASHYRLGDTQGPEPIDLIERYGLDFHLGNVVKYVVREKGDKKENLEKARWYLDRYLQLLNK